MPDEFEQRAESVLADAAAQFDPSHGWAAGQQAAADFALLARRLELDKQTDRRAPSIRHQERRHQLRPWLGYGLAMAMAVVMAGVGFHHIQEHRSELALSAMHAYEARRGQQVTQQLPDGSRLTLAPDSRARYVVRDGKRVVELEGQAFFDVRSDAQRPFVVESEGITTRVAGTSFVVRSYPGDPTRCVAVVTGTVVVTPDEKEPSSVGAGYMASVSHGRMILAPVKTFDSDVLSWLSGGLVFQATSLEDVIVELERRFDVSIDVVDPSIRMRRFTMEFDNPSLAEVLDVLAPTIGARYEQGGNQIILRAQ